MKLFETRKGNIYTKIISEYLFCLRDKFLVYATKLFIQAIFKLTANYNPDKHKNSNYGFGFHASGSFSFSDSSGIGKRIAIFGADMSSSMPVDHKKKDILIFGDGLTERLNDTILMI